VSLFGFGRHRPSAAEQLRSGAWTCSSCRQIHRWPMDLAAFAPDPWGGAEAYEPNGALRTDGDFLSEDFCVLGGEHFLVRAVLLIPVAGMEDFGFGCWTSLSRPNFDRYVEHFDDGQMPEGERWSGWLCSGLADYTGTDPLALWVQPRAERQRPLLWVMDDNHPLAVAQDHGVSPERMVEILDRYGHAPER
jgi:hypothetical protein